MQKTFLCQLTATTLFPTLLYLLLLSAPSTLADGLPAAQFIPMPAKATSAPYQPQAIMPGGIVLPVWPPDSPMLNAQRLHEAEVYTMHHKVPGRIHNIVNIHNPSIEIHTVEPNTNTGAAIILIAGGGHKKLIIASEGSDFASYFYNYGINCIILRNRLRSDGYNAEVDAVNDTLQAVRLVRSNAKQLGIDPNKIGVMGFSAGGELASGASLFYEQFDTEHTKAGDPLAGISSRPDFTGLIYTGPSALTSDPELEIPVDAPPSFIASASYGEARHTVWAMDYYRAMLDKSIPNIELHLYGNGWHGGGIKDRQGMPYGTWSLRFIDWFRDLGFLNKPGIPTKAAIDIQTILSKDHSSSQRRNP